MNMTKAHERIQQFYEGELSQLDPRVRAALGRRLEVDARFRAIENYLEELAYSGDPELEAAVDAVERDYRRGDIHEVIRAYEQHLRPVMRKRIEKRSPDPDCNADRQSHVDGVLVCGCQESKALRAELGVSQRKCAERSMALEDAESALKPARAAAWIEGYNASVRDTASGAEPVNPYVDPPKPVIDIVDGDDIPF